MLELSATLDFRGGAVTGTLTDPGDKPVIEMMVLLVQADPKKRPPWIGDPFAFSDKTGAFKIQGVAPGDYLLMAWPINETGPLLDPEVFAKAQKYAVSVTIERSGVVTQGLKVPPELRALAEAFAQ